MSMETTTLAISIITALTILLLVRRDRLHVKHGSVWIFVAGGIGCIGLFPTLIDKIGESFGVAYPPTFFAAIGVVGLMLKALMTDIELSKTQVRYARLVQRLAIIEAQAEKSVDYNRTPRSDQAKEKSNASA